MIYVFWSCCNKTEAKKIIYDLLELRLIACASIIPEVESIYRWQGKIEESQEIKVILKSTENHFNAIQNFIRLHGSYKVSEVTQLNITACNPLYLSWLVQETSV